MTKAVTPKFRPVLESFTFSAGFAAFSGLVKQIFGEDVSNDFIHLCLGALIFSTGETLEEEFKKEIPKETGWQRFTRLANPLFKLPVLGFAAFMGTAQWAKLTAFGAFTIILGDRARKELAAGNRVNALAFFLASISNTGAIAGTVKGNDNVVMYSLLGGSAACTLLFVQKARAYLADAKVADLTQPLNSSTASIL